MRRLINEEGLPIVDITEPVTAVDYAFRPDPEGHFDDPDLLPVWTLSPAERERRRAERERILDLLEEEERAQGQRDAEAERERHQQETERRKAAAKTEMENLKKARELQKKLGRALIRSVVESRDKEEKEKADLTEHDRLTAAGTKAPKAKKSVSFAHDIDENGRIKSEQKEKADVDWGDVAPGTLRLSGKHSPESYDRQPMKLHVVERHPRSLGQPSFQPTQDSDDESNPGSLEDGAEGSDSEDGFIGNHQPPESEESEDDLPRDEQISDWNDEDFDFVQHQREVALEYYHKRRTIGAEAASAMRAHTHNEDEWDQPEVPLEATLASAPPKSSISRFKAERTTHAKSNQISLASHSLGASVIPSSSSSSIKRAVRMGKLESGKLVGGDEGDSEDEVLAHDEKALEMLELLKKGEVTNIGPTSELATATSHQPPLVPVSAVEELGPTQQPLLPKVSKFKLSLSHPEPSQLLSSGTSASASTPIDLSERSSPKMMTPRGNSPDANTSSSSSSSSSQPRFTLPAELQAAYQRGEIQAQMPGMVVDSPSFLAPRASFAYQADSLSLTSTAVPTPTSPSPSSPASALPDAEKSTPSPNPLRQAVVERRPPTVTSSRAQSQAHSSTESPTSRVSKFKAQRS
ncbi:hypothetical protein BC835DRAFT_138940 [Cytidiella melzeri]|nr:hypothetical protein BC835DRAFT_138940 [Cytidiella melzeri]